MFGSTRVQAIQAELDRAADEYVYSKDAYDEARVRFETAREKFASIKNLAGTMMTTMDWYQWQLQHQQVRYAAMGIGDAITEALRSYAFDTAWAHLANPTQRPYDPYRSLDEIAAELERGGFEFRTTATGREANAALINLATVKKHPQDGRHAIANADEILGWCRAFQNQQKAG